MLIDTPSVEFGWKAADFELADPQGTQHSLEQLMGEHGILIAFICNHCPYVKAIATRLAEDAKLLQEQGVSVVAINSNDYQYVPEDSPDNMILFAERYGFTFPYLVDEDQRVAREYGAVCTPDFFGFDTAGHLQYRGRLDDTKMGDANHRIPELVNAMLQVKENGKGPSEQHASMGCSIKWKR
ncbi:MAG: thioredoxin family protein [Acidiferrobacterales bacterium]|nr:thioredoxin family protein [Acidiferrobacterales bacterium]